MKREYIFCSLAIIVAIPILLNIVLGANNPFQNITIIGDSTHWLGFYGSYLGGILAAFIGIFTIYCQSKHNALNIMIREQSNYIEKLNLELTDLVSSVEFWYLGSVSLDVIGIKTKQEDIFPKLEAIKKTHLHKLNELHRNATNKGNHWELTYSKRDDAYIEDLSEKFLACYRQYTEDIHKLIYNLSITTPNNIDELYIFLTQFNKDIKSHTDLFQKPLYDAAKAWVTYEENKLKAMKKEQKKMMPNLDIAN